MGVLGELGDLADGVKQGVSDGVNATAGVLGDSLDGVGLKSAGEKVRDGAEYLTGAVGAVVPERELGETDEPGELIHGSTGDIEDAVRHLKAFATAFESVGQALKKLDPGHWTGTAAESFRESFTTHPKKWLTAADACTAAAQALASYADTVSWARGQAGEAIEKWRAAEAKSTAARQKYDQQFWEYQSALTVGSLSGSGTETPTDPGDFVDPGEVDRGAARERLKDARHTRDSAAETAATKVTGAFEAAPAEPGAWARFKAGLIDAPMAVNMELEHFAGGFLKGGIGLTRMMRTVNPLDPYNLTHPSQYLRNVSITGMGLLTSANHPVRTAKSMAGSGWSTDPSEALGTAFFDVGLDLLTGGAGASAGAARRTFTAGVKDAMETGVERGAREGMGTTAENAGESAARDVAKDGLPDGWTFKQGQEAADVTADAAKDVARDKWGDAAGSGHGSSAPEAGAGRAAPDWDDLQDLDKHRSAIAEISDGAVTFKGNADALQYGAKHWNDYAENLPTDQQAAVRNYTGSEYHKINGLLRGNDYYDTPVVRQQIEQIDRALAGNRLPEDVIVTRGTDLGHYLEKMATNNPRDMVGEVFNEEAYMSTSLGDTVFSNKEAVLHLRAPEGTPGLWVEKLSHYGANERELLLGRSNEYTITKAFKDANGQWQIYGKIHL
ncbi:ADP-ribosyltransferase [Streptomyces canus]|uniref:putative T7SS-secreted protein n=1 Tax=Streptomyces canus TaxID=58343 RepID=UPI002E29DB08|nr:ADP-ribosyltransferase [Streptomyces canus]